MIDSRTLPKTIYSGAFDTSHCQGIAVDTGRKYMYYSFTQQLVKNITRDNDKSPQRKIREIHRAMQLEKN